VPEDAVCDSYSITLSYGGESCVFNDVLKIVERAGD